MISILGHHGTEHAAALSILRAGFRKSIGDSEWLGDGVYFFVDGLNAVQTTTLAQDWAKCSAWDNRTKNYKYQNYAIIQSVIKVEKCNFLDLTTSEGIEVLSYLVEKYEEKLKTISKKVTFYDGSLLNLARNENILPLEVVKGNFFIKFEKERIKRVNLRTSNCTICSVYSPNKVIFSNSIIKTGSIL